MNFVETETPLNGIAKMFVCKEEICIANQVHPMRKVISKSYLYKIAISLTIEIDFSLMS